MERARTDGMLDVFVLPETNSSPYIAPENRGPLDPNHRFKGPPVSFMEGYI